jgi:hypothetical protein
LNFYLVTSWQGYFNAIAFAAGRISIDKRISANKKYQEINTISLFFVFTRICSIRKYLPTSSFSPENGEINGNTLFPYHSRKGKSIFPFLKQALI